MQHENFSEIYFHKIKLQKIHICIFRLMLNRLKMLAKSCRQTSKTKQCSLLYIHLKICDIKKLTYWFLFESFCKKISCISHVVTHFENLLIQVITKPFFRTFPTSDKEPERSCSFRINNPWNENSSVFHPTHHAFFNCCDVAD